MAVKCGTVAVGADMSVGLVDKKTNKYYVEKIVDWWIAKAQGGKPGKVKLRVKWDGWPDPRDHTWEDLETILEDCPTVVSEYIRTMRKTKPPKERLIRACEEAKLWLTTTKGIQFSESDDQEAVLESGSENGEASAAAQQQEKEKKGKKKKKATGSAPTERDAGADGSEKKQQRGKGKGSRAWPRFSVVMGREAAGYDVQSPEAAASEEPLANPPAAAEAPPANAPAAAEEPPKVRRRKQKGKVSAGKNTGKTPPRSEYPLGKGLPYDSIKGFRFLRVDGVIHRCFPESALIYGETSSEDSSFKIPTHIGATMDLPELATVGYWVKLEEEEAYGLVFREVAERCFPDALKSYLKKEERFLRVPIGEE